MKVKIIAPMGRNLDDLYVAIREFEVNDMVLIASKEHEKIAKKTKQNLEKFGIPVSVRNIGTDLWENTFEAIAEINAYNSDSELEILILVSTGDWDSRCAATSAAFVNGLKACTVSDGKVMLLPVLKFSYYKLIPDKKKEVLESLYKAEGCCTTLDELSKAVRISSPLLSYHIHGNRNSDGLEEMGLIEIEEKKGKTKVRLTLLGRMVLKGHVK